MNTNKFGLLSLAGVVSALTFATPALAHEDWHGHGRYGHFVPGHRVVVRPVFVEPGPVVVYRPYPVYYAPAPVVYAPAPIVYAPAPAYPSPTAAATFGGAITGAAIGAIASHGKPGAIVAGTVLGAVVGNGLAR